MLPGIRIVSRSLDDDLAPFQPQPQLTKDELVKQLRYITKAVEALTLAVEAGVTIPAWATARISRAAALVGMAVSATRASRRKE